MRTPQRDWPRRSTLALALLAAGVAAGDSSAQTPPPTAQGAGATGSSLDDRQVRTTILTGSPPSRPNPAPAVRTLPGGDISLNFPGVEVTAVTKAILGDTLGLKYAVDPNVHGPVTVQTAHPIRRAAVLGFFEQSLTAANLVLADRGGVFTVLPAATARGEAPVVGPMDPGFGNETIQLKFVNAEELRKLLDPLVPNAISVADPTQNILVVSGTSTQRSALRELVQQFDVDWLKGMSFGLYIPQRTDARLIAPELEKLLNAPGAQSAGLVRLIAMDRLNGILAITSQPQYLEDVQRFVEILDREGESSERRLFVYHVQNGRAADLAKVLDAAFGIAEVKSDTTGTEPPPLTDVTGPPPPSSPIAGANANVVTGLAQRAITLASDAARQINTKETSPASANGTTITADETNNAIVVFSTPRDYALIEDALRKLDVPPLQVFIEASISEVTLNHTLQYGIQWNFQNGDNTYSLTQGAGTPPNTPTQVFPAFSFLHAGPNIQATINALATVTDVTVLSAPKLMVLNNHTATIDVGDQVPISTGSSVGTLVPNAPIVNSIDYRDTGIILKITPRVNTGGLVLLDIAQEVSDVLPISQAQLLSGINSPTIEQRKIATSVAVQDGETVALGGLIKNEIQKGRSTIPILGSIPILGHLFGDTSGGLIRTELIVLLTPHVVRTPVDARLITADLKSKIEMAPTPPPPPPPPPAKLPRHPANGA